MAQAALVSNGDPFRQGFVGYVYVGALKWRVMLRLQDEAGTWRGRLRFSDTGGTEVWDREELAGQSPEELLQQARSLPAEDLIRRFRQSYGERRRYYALRALADDLMEHVRALNRIAVRAEGGELDMTRAGREITRIQERMHLLVNGLWDVAGKEGRRAD